MPKAAIRRLFDQLGGVKRVAAKLVLSVSQTYAFADPGVADEISFARVVALTGPTSTAGAECLARFAGGVFLPIDSDDTTLGELTADCIREHGEACAELVRAMSDGQLLPAEVAPALLAIDDAIRVLVRLRAGVAAKAKGEGRDTTPTG
jgi:hypothetical protein